MVDNIERINGNNHVFNIILDNGTTKVGIKFAAIDELVIIDDLRYFYSYGKMTFTYNQDALESYEQTNTEPGAVKSSQKPFIFRGDGRDFLEVEIMPQMKDSECLEPGASESDREKYCIKHIFSIYHYEDDTDGAGFKRRTLFFWDRDFQYLNNIQVDFSTDMLLQQGSSRESINVNSSDVNIKQSTQNNSVYTGDAIKGLLEYTLRENYGVEVKFGDWEAGASKINYTSPAQYRAVDDLDFLVTYHVSDDSNQNLPAILKKQRYTDEYQLWPINYYYDNSKQSSSSILEGLLGGSSKTEDFYIGKLNTGTGDMFNSSTSKGIATEYTVIDNYNFVKVSAKELQEFFTTYAVHTNDPRGSFKADIQPNNYQKIKTLYDQTFVQPNNVASTNGAPVTNLPDNLIREQHKNTRHVFVPYALEEKQRKSFGINRTMLNLFFKNTSITFTARGNTARQSGKLITINRRNSDIQPTHDSNLLGQYLIVYLRHEFKGGTYVNSIHATKPYTTMNPEFAKLP